MKLSDPTVIVTLVLVGLIGVLLLAAHQADEAGHKRAGVILLFSAVASLIVLVVGPLAILGMLLIGLLYVVFFGLP
ncbi:MAG: hypothetical protein ACYDCQ_16275, partial [Dehalococcoidia bacterium]